MKQNTAKTEGQDSQVRFQKQELLKAACFREQRDILYALLSERTEYSIEEAKHIITEYLKGKVN